MARVWGWGDEMKSREKVFDTFWLPVTIRTLACTREAELFEAVDLANEEVCIWSEREVD